MTTTEEAIENAARVLHEAELERSNLELMGRLDAVAATWVRIAELLAERERV